MNDNACTTVCATSKSKSSPREFFGVVVSAFEATVVGSLVSAGEYGLVSGIRDVPPFSAVVCALVTSSKDILDEPVVVKESDVNDGIVVNSVVVACVVKVELGVVIDVDEVFISETVEIVVKTVVDTKSGTIIVEVASFFTVVDLVLTSGTDIPDEPVVVKESDVSD